MRQDVAADGLAAVGAGEEGRGAGVGLDLVCLRARTLLARLGGVGRWRGVVGRREEGGRARTMRTQTLNSGRSPILARSVSQSVRSFAEPAQSPHTRCLKIRPSDAPKATTGGGGTERDVT